MFVYVAICRGQSGLGQSVFRLCLVPHVQRIRLFVGLLLPVRLFLRFLVESGIRTPNVKFEKLDLDPPGHYE